MQAILFTNSVGDMSKLKPILFIIHHSLAVNKRNTVDNEVTMRRVLSRVFSTKVVVFFSYKTTKALIHFPERKLYQRFYKIII